nr:serine/threonine-protein kinase [Micromonospora sp. DSM 115978]
MTVVPDIEPLEHDDPTQVGPYQLSGRLGTGGMGTVYCGSTPDGRTVAVKVIRREFARDPEVRGRFLREAQAAQRVARFCTAEVLDVDTDGARPYLVTEFIDGPTLTSVIAERGKLPIAELERLAVAVVSALTAIHAAGLVHRDLKPSNIILSSSGARVIDFGIARTTDATGGLTQTGASIGTPAFMAP